MRYVPYHKLGNSPNIIVDGKANHSTVLTLSHWPDSNTPEKYKDDLSAQIVFRYLEEAQSSTADTEPSIAAAECVSNNHFDEDGLVSLFAMLYPEQALQYKEVLIDIASAGDFGVFKSRDAARVSFVLSAWANSELSPLNSSVFARPYPELTSILYQELLLRLPKIIEKIDHLRRYWQEEDDFYELSSAAIKDGRIILKEHPSEDLLVVDVTPGFPGYEREHAASWISSVVHPMVLHNQTQSSRVLVMQGRRYELYFRYESWVEYISRPIRPRIDLKNLAVSLSNKEKGTGALWHFNGVDEIIARLQLKNAEKSQIGPGDFLELVKANLAD